ncbi:MAG: hypothetical protein R3E32_07035 [Chitinophagales bacterium]
MKKIIIYCLFLFNISILNAQNNVSLAFSYSNGLNFQYFSSNGIMTQHQGDIIVDFGRNPMFYSFQLDYNVRNNKVSWGSGLTMIRRNIPVRYRVGTSNDYIGGGIQFPINIISIPLRYTRRIPLNKNIKLLGSVNIGIDLPERIRSNKHFTEQNNKSVEYAIQFWSPTTNVSAGFDIGLENDFGKWGQIVFGVGKYKRLGDSYTFNMNYVITKHDMNLATIGNIQRNITEDVWRTYLTYRLPIRFKISRL